MIENEADVTELEQGIEQIKEEDVAMENIFKVKTSNESESSAKI